MNGPILPENFWERLDERFDRIYDKIDKVNTEISSINANGCAHRDDDLRRIELLEAWKNKGLIGIIILAMGIILNFFGIRDFVP